MEKKLFRSKKNRIFTGLCGDIGEYFDVDPTFIRLGMVLLSMCYGVGLGAYIIASIIVPSQN